jgi:hypothetical protein
MALLVRSAASNGGNNATNTHCLPGQSESDRFAFGRRRKRVLCSASRERKVTTHIVPPASWQLANGKSVFGILPTFRSILVDTLNPGRKRMISPLRRNRRLWCFTFTEPMSTFPRLGGKSSHGAPCATTSTNRPLTFATHCRRLAHTWFNLCKTCPKGLNPGKAIALIKQNLKVFGSCGDSLVANALRRPGPVRDGGYARCQMTHIVTVDDITRRLVCMYYSCLLFVC